MQTTTPVRRMISVAVNRLLALLGGDESLWAEGRGRASQVRAGMQSRPKLPDIWREGWDAHSGRGGIHKTHGTK